MTSRPGGSAATANSAATPESPVPSPCISVCKMTEMTRETDALCVGCLRTIDEIVAWGGASDAYKRSVWVRIAARRQERDRDGP